MELVAVEKAGLPGATPGWRHVLGYGTGFRSHGECLTFFILYMCSVKGETPNVGVLHVFYSSQKTSKDENCPGVGRFVRHLQLQSYEKNQIIYKIGIKNFDVEVKISRFFGIILSSLHLWA